MSVRASPLAITALTLLAVTACESIVEPPLRDESAPIQTDELSYELRSVRMGARVGADGEVGVVGLEVDLSFTYTNLSDGPIHLQNCNGQFSLAMQRRVGDSWEAVRLTEMEGCWSPPVVISPGETFRHSLEARGAPPRTKTFPQWEVEDPRGIVRIVWGGVETSSGDRLPLEERVSNPFALN